MSKRRFRYRVQSVSESQEGVIYSRSIVGEYRSYKRALVVAAARAEALRSLDWRSYEVVRIPACGCGCGGCGRLRLASFSCRDQEGRP